MVFVSAISLVEGGGGGEVGSFILDSNALCIWTLINKWPISVLRRKEVLHFTAVIQEKYLKCIL